MACVFVTSPAKEKCARCWRYLAEKSGREDFPPVCERCEEVLTGPLEPGVWTTLRARFDDCGGA